jgi:hypothetical protein
MLAPWTLQQQACSSSAQVRPAEQPEQLLLFEPAASLPWLPHSASPECTLSECGVRIQQLGHWWHVMVLALHLFLTSLLPCKVC